MFFFSVSLSPVGTTKVPTDCSRKRCPRIDTSNDQQHKSKSQPRPQIYVTPALSFPPPPAAPLDILTPPAATSVHSPRYNLCPFLPPQSLSAGCCDWRCLHPLGPFDVPLVHRHPARPGVVLLSLVGTTAVRDRGTIGGSATDLTRGLQLSGLFPEFARSLHFRI